MRARANVNPARHSDLVAHRTLAYRWEFRSDVLFSERMVILSGLRRAYDLCDCWPVGRVEKLGCSIAVSCWQFSHTRRTGSANGQAPAEENIMSDGSPTHGMSTAEGPEGEACPIKVMVIDDSKTIRRTAETLLKKAGYEVITATDGFESLSRIVDHGPDIIFVDIMMPRLDGYQTCALIKRNALFKKTPVIMLSSKDGLFDRARGRIVGSDQYLTKPFTRDELLGAIENHLGPGKKVASPT
jgi:twitching motility two-component system response regulator PilG